jgi:hypothetical protein
LVPCSTALPVSFAGSLVDLSEAGSAPTGSPCPLAVGSPSLAFAARPFAPTTAAVFSLLVTPSIRRSRAIVAP